MNSRKFEIGEKAPHHKDSQTTLLNQLHCEQQKQRFQVFLQPVTWKSQVFL